MKKGMSKPLIMVAFVFAVLGVSSVPLSAGATSGQDWHDDSWSQDSHDWNKDNEHDWNDDNNYNHDNGYVNNYNHWQDDSNGWHNDYNNWYRISDWEARSMAQNHFPGQWIVAENQWWGHDGRLQRQYHFSDNHVIVIRDDGVVIIILQQ